MSQQFALQEVQRNLAAVYDEMQLQEDEAANWVGNERTDGADAPAQTATGAAELHDRAPAHHVGAANESQAEEQVRLAAAGGALHRIQQPLDLTGSPAISWKEAASGTRAGTSPVGSPPMYVIDDACWLEEPATRDPHTDAHVPAQEQQHAQHGRLIAEQPVPSEQEDTSQEVLLQPLHQRQPSFVTRQAPLDATEPWLSQQLPSEPNQPQAPLEQLPAAAMNQTQDFDVQQVQDNQAAGQQQAQLPLQDAAAQPASHPIESAVNSQAGSSEGLELRMFTPDTSRRVGLESGDVVVLMLQGRMYTVTQAALPGLNIKGTTPSPAATPGDVEPSHDLPLHYVLELGQETWPPSPHTLLASVAARAQRKSPAAHARSHSSCGDATSLPVIKAPSPTAADTQAAADAAGAAARDDRALSAPAVNGSAAATEDADCAGESSTQAAVDPRGDDGNAKLQRRSITSLLGSGLMSVVRRGLSAPTTPTASANDAAGNPLAPTATGSTESAAALSLAAAVGAEPGTFSNADAGQSSTQVTADGSGGELVLQAFGSGAFPTPTSPSAMANQPIIPAQCCLEVVRQGEYLGLRSATAGWRYLQPRKRSPHSLVFFNTKCGAWEQWEVVGDADIRHPWSLLPLMLRSRRLPHVTLHVEVARVGAYGPPPCLPFLNSVPAVRLDRDSSAVRAAHQELGLHALLYGEELLEEKPPPPMSLLDENSSYMMRETSESDAGSLLPHHSSHFPHAESRMYAAVHPGMLGFRTGNVRSFPVRGSTTDSSDAPHPSEARHTGGGMAMLAEEDYGAAADAVSRHDLSHTDAQQAVHHSYDRELHDRSASAMHVNPQQGPEERAVPTSAVSLSTTPHVQHDSHAADSEAMPAPTLTGLAMSQEESGMAGRGGHLSSRHVATDGGFSAENSRQVVTGPMRRNAPSHASHSSYRPASHTSQGGATGDLSEDENLRRISGLLVSEWFRFVDVEKNSRRRVEGELAAAIAELRALRVDASTQVDQIRSQMRGELVGLFHAVQVRDGLLTAAKATRRRALTVAVAALWRRRAQQVQSAVLLAWQGWALAQRTQRSLADSHYQGICRRRAATQLLAWSAWARWKARTRHVVVQRVLKVSRQLLAAALAAWATWARRKVQLRALVLRGIMSTSRRRMLEVFRHWQMTCYQMRTARQALQHIGVRNDALLQARVFAALQHVLAHAARNEQLALQQLSHWQHKQLHSMFTAWQLASQHKRAKRLRQLQMDVWYERHLHRAAFAGWAGVLQQAKAAAAAAALLATKHKERLQAACITTWQARLQQQAVVDRKVGILRARHGAHRLQRSFNWWRVWAGAQHETTRAVQQVQATCARRVHRAVLTALSQHVALRRAQVLATSRHRQRLLARSWCAWWERCAAIAQATKLLAEVPPRMRARTTADALLVWLSIAQHHTARRQQQMQRLSASAKAALRVGLGVWWQSHTATTFRITTAPDTTTMPASSDTNQTRSISLGLASPMGLFSLPQATAFSNNKSQAAAGLDADDMTSSTPTKAVTASHTLTPSTSGSGGAGEYQWLLHVALAGWQQVVASSQQLAAAASQLQGAWQARRLARTLAAWRATCQHSQHAAVQAQQHWQATKVQQVLLYWHDITQYHAAQRRLVARHTSRTKSAQLTAAWQAWRQQCTSLSVARQAAELRAQSYMHELMREVLHAWHDASKGVRQADTTSVDRLSRAQAILQRMRTRQVLRAWLLATQAVQYADSLATAHACSQLLRRCFAQLQAYTTHRQHKQQQTTRAVAKHAQTSVARVWSAWRQAVHTSHEAGHMAASAWRTSMQGAVLRCWHQEALEQVAWRRLGARVGRHMSRHRALSVLHAWQSLCQMQQHSRAHAGMLSQLKQQQLVASCFQGWLQLTRSQCHARQVAMHAAHKAEQRLMRRAFEGWSAVCTQLHAARLCCEDTAAFCNVRLVQAAWDSWLLAVQGDGMAAKLVGSGQAGMPHAARWGQRRTLERTMRHWMRVVQCVRHREEFVTLALSRRQVRVQQQVLRMWSMLAALRSSRRLALARHLVRREQHVQRMHLRHWKLVVDETRQRAELLRACVKRKKIAFQQFKTWYWESFDADVQETIRRMFYTTEQALQDAGPSPLDPSLMATFQQQGSAAAATESSPYMRSLSQQHAGSTQPLHSHSVQPQPTHTSAYASHADGRQYSTGGSIAGQYSQLQQQRPAGMQSTLLQQQQQQGAAHQPAHLQQATQQQQQHRQPVSLRYTTSFDTWAGGAAAHAAQADALGRRGTASSNGAAGQPERQQRTMAPVLTGPHQRASHSSEGYGSHMNSGSTAAYVQGGYGFQESASSAWQNVAQNNLFMQQAYDNQLYDDAGAAQATGSPSGHPSMLSGIGMATGTTPHSVTRTSTSYLRTATASAAAAASPATSLTAAQAHAAAGQAAFQIRSNPGCRLYSDSDDDSEHEGSRNHEPEQPSNMSMLAAATGASRNQCAPQSHATMQQHIGQRAVAAGGVAATSKGSSRSSSTQGASHGSSTQMRTIADAMARQQQQQQQQVTTLPGTRRPPSASRP